jgi:hypothetical protein
LTSTARDRADRGLWFWLVGFIAASTVAAGLVQLAVPGFVLDLLDADRSATAKHFFAIVGMFMAVIGALLGHALLRSPTNERDVVLLWAAVQKGGAFVAVTLGVVNDVFSSLGLLVAANDLASSMVLLWYRRYLAAAR